MKKVRDKKGRGSYIRKTIPQKTHYFLKHPPIPTDGGGGAGGGRVGRVEEVDDPLKHPDKWGGRGGGVASMNAF